MPTKRKHATVPNYRELIKPCLQAIQELGGSGNIEEIDARAIKLSKQPEKVLDVRHDGGELTEIEYQLAWSRTYLKYAGYITNPGRGVWRLLKSDIKIETLDVKEILRMARANKTSTGGGDSATSTTPPDSLPPESALDWKDVLLKELKLLKPDSFERLTQLILRESGFSQVEVLGRSGDGGIDGMGILKIKGVLSFYVYFQCKRYAESVGSAAVRDFRGAMQGRSDKGVIITTGRFTAEASKEAQRAGAVPIELVDGSALCDLMKDLRIGVSVELVESMTVDASSLASI